MSLPVEQDAAFVRRLESGEHPQQRGLAAAARAEQREELAGPDVERQPVHRAKGAELLHHRLDAQQRNVRRGRRRRRGLHGQRRRFRLRFGFCSSSAIFLASPMLAAR